MDNEAIIQAIVAHIEQMEALRKQLDPQIASYVESEVEDLKERLAASEANRKGSDAANNITYGLMVWERNKWRAIYRIVFPAESPWAPVDSDIPKMPGTTHSPYIWAKLIKRLQHLVAADELKDEASKRGIHPGEAEPKQVPEPEPSPEPSPEPGPKTEE